MKISRPVAIALLTMTAGFARAGKEEEVAIYNSILASVEPGQTTVAMGDMLVPVKLVRAWRDKLMGLRASSLTSATLWPGGVVYYAFDDTVTEEKRRHFRDACAEWGLFGNLTFTPRTNEPNYIFVQEDPDRIGGASNLGMAGGGQFFTMRTDGWNRRTLLLVIGYALGLTLEHNRSDRETYVQILTENIRPGWEANFVRVFNSTNNTPYDFDSIMHYRDSDLSVEPELDVIVCRPAYAEHQDTMGRIPLDRWLSRQDRATIAQLYGPGPALSATVTHTNDSGPGSLRAALYHTLDLATDAPASSPVISFQIPLTDPGYSDGVFTIRPTGRLPGPGPRVTVDGTTQTAFTGNTNSAGPEIVLSGERITLPHEFGRAFILGDDRSVVRSLVIQGCNGPGITISGTNNRVEGCYIGTNASGTATVPNGEQGVSVVQGAKNNVIGGATAAERNVISGNVERGIVINGTGTSGNVVRGNYIGTNAAATAAVGNGFSGVAVNGGAADNTVGPGNVISGNLNQGVALNGDGVSGNAVTGNFIGTDAAGSAALPNAWNGVGVFGGATNNLIGPGNVIGGNLNQGVVLNNAGTTGNVVRENSIGTNAAGTAALANGWSGVSAIGGASGNTVGPGNVISGNANEGVLVTDAGTSGNVVTGNTIGMNAAQTAVLPNAFAGVQVNLAAQGNVIGGSSAADRNIISGNLKQGIAISGTGSTGNVVRGNYIGTNLAGTAPFPNAWSGVAVNTGAADNTVGPGNVISGNANQGVVLNGMGVSGNLVTGNFIGTNAAGTAALANAWSGVAVAGGATSNVVGPGNVISANLNQGIVITAAGTNGNTVKGNLVGLNAAGTAALPNAWSGVQMSLGAQANIIGGFMAADRNVISGNTQLGVAINGADATGNIVRGNFVGTNAAGTAAVANVQGGVEVFGGAVANVIGGVEAGAGNVISGNNVRGIAISGAGTNANVCTGNLIGLNAAGTAALANAGAGIGIFGSAQDTVIGATAGGRNFIAGNANSGIRISVAGTNGTRILGNSIGVTPAGAVVANNGDGVEVFTGALNTVVGGSAPGSANLIRGNTRDGVGVFDAATIVAIEGNSIFGNGGEGIDLGGNGVTANDAGDGDTGPNGLQNFPVLTSAVLGTGTTIAGTLNTTANAAVRIHYYASPSGDEGQFFIGSQSGTANASGNLTINTTLAARVPAGYVITATATGPGNNTSEFSAPRAVTTTDGDSDGMPDVWEAANGLASGSNDAALDADSDGQSNLDEFRAGTDPRDPNSLLHPALSTDSGGVSTVSFAPVAGITSRVEYSPSMAFGSWLPLADQLQFSGGGSLFVRDPSSVGISRRFYRVIVIP